MSPILLILMIIAIIVALIGVFMRRRPESPGRRRMLWMIGILGGIAIVIALLLLLTR